MSQLELSAHLISFACINLGMFSSTRINFAETARKETRNPQTQFLYNSVTLYFCPMGIPDSYLQGMFWARILLGAWAPHIPNC